CAVVACASGTDAQDTFRFLRGRAGAHAGEVVLLHARMPGHQREAITGGVRRGLGPAGPRPQRLIVVTTTLLDMSLDIDADLMVSDLAPLAWLLQRLGRLWRFEARWQDQGPDRRPRWARAQAEQAGGPRLVVLEPVGDDGTLEIPRWWPESMEPYLLETTADLLAADPVRPVTLPDDVPYLLADFAARLHTGPAGARAAHEANRVFLEHLGESQLVPPPARTGSLADLYRRPTGAGHAATREGERPRRLVACYRAPGRSLSLDRDGALPLETGHPLRPADVRAVLERTIAVPAAWIAQAQAPAVPAAWAEHPLLAELTLLVHDADHPGPVRCGSHLLYVDPDLGLVHETDPA
ncbi:CRISPR-associated helicase/endonuclease Cas3, partial [Streptomyces violascens]